MPDLPGDQLMGRIQFLTRSKVIEYKDSTREIERILRVATKLRDMVQEGHINSFLALESAFNFLHEKTEEDESRLDEYVREIQDFVI